MADEIRKIALSSEEKRIGKVPSHSPDPLLPLVFLGGPRSGARARRTVVFVLEHLSGLCECGMMKWATATVHYLANHDQPAGAGVIYVINPAVKIMLVKSLKLLSSKTRGCWRQNKVLLSIFHSLPVL